MDKWENGQVRFGAFCMLATFTVQFRHFSLTFLQPDLQTHGHREGQARPELPDGDSEVPGPERGVPGPHVAAPGPQLQERAWPADLLPQCHPGPAGWRGADGGLRWGGEAPGASGGEWSRGQSQT